jgi:hypothetical protein
MRWRRAATFGPADAPQQCMIAARDVTEAAAIAVATIEKDITALLRAGSALVAR